MKKKINIFETKLSNLVYTKHSFKTDVWHFFGIMKAEIESINPPITNPNSY